MFFKYFLIIIIFFVVSSSVFFFFFLSRSEIVELVKAGGRRPLRPHVDASECEDGVEALLLSCWRESASERPDFSSLRTTVKKMCPSGSVPMQHFNSGLKKKKEGTYEMLLLCYRITNRIGCRAYLFGLDGE